MVLNRTNEEAEKNSDLVQDLRLDKRENLRVFWYHTLLFVVCYTALLCATT